MRFNILSLIAMISATILGSSSSMAQENTAMVMVMIENISPEGGVALTPLWGGFHNGSFDSYNGGLLSLEGLERIAEDGNTSLLSGQFNDFDPVFGGYTYVDNSGDSPRSALVRTGNLADVYRQDATIGAGPLLPGDSASEIFELRLDGSNDYFSYVSMVLPTNDYFVANGSPVAHDLSDILETGGEISFFIGTPNGGVNDAGTERNGFRFAAGNGLFPMRFLPRGQNRPNQGPPTMDPIANVVGPAFADFRLNSLGRVPNRRGKRPSINVAGLDFNQYPSGIGLVTITVLAPGN